MALYRSFEELVKQQSEETKSKLENLGHALDGEDLSSTEFVVKAKRESYYMALGITGMMILFGMRVSVREAAHMALDMDYNIRQIYVGGAVMAAAVLFTIFFFVSLSRKKIQVKGSEMTFRKKTYHCSDITSAKMEILNNIVIYTGNRKKLLRFSLGEFDNSEKLAAWLERCNIPIERDEKKLSSNETVFKIFMIFAGIGLGLALCIAMGIM